MHEMGKPEEWQRKGRCKRKLIKGERGESKNDDVKRKGREGLEGEGEEGREGKGRE